MHHLTGDMSRSSETIREEKAFVSLKTVKTQTTQGITRLCPVNISLQNPEQSLRNTLEPGWDEAMSGIHTSRGGTEEYLSTVRTLLPSYSILRNSQLSIRQSLDKMPQKQGSVSHHHSRHITEHTAILMSWGWVGWHGCPAVLSPSTDRRGFAQSASCPMQLRLMS